MKGGKKKRNRKTTTGLRHAIRLSKMELKKIKKIIEQYEEDPFSLQYEDRLKQYRERVERACLLENVTLPKLEEELMLLQIQKKKKRGRA